MRSRVAVEGPRGMAFLALQRSETSSLGFTGLWDLGHSSQSRCHQGHIELIQKRFTMFGQCLDSCYIAVSPLCYWAWHIIGSHCWHWFLLILTMSSAYFVSSFFSNKGFSWFLLVHVNSQLWSCAARQIPVPFEVDHQGKKEASVKTIPSDFQVQALFFYSPAVTTFAKQEHFQMPWGIFKFNQLFVHLYLLSFSLVTAIETKHGAVPLELGSERLPVPMTPEKRNTFSGLFCNCVQFLLALGCVCVWVRRVLLSELRSLLMVANCFGRRYELLLG